MTDDIQILKMRGLLMWPKLFYPDTMYEDKWTTDLLLNEEGKKEAASHGLRIKTNEKYVDQFDGYDGSFLRVDRPVVDNKGETREAPKVVIYNTGDPGPKDVPSDTPLSSGTEALVRFIVKTRNKTGSTMSPAEAMKEYGGYGMFLTGVQILKPVLFERTSDPDTDFVAEDGSYDGFDFDKGDESPFAA